MPASKPKIEKICPICSTLFLVKPSVADIRRCCSVKCQGLWKRSTRTARNCKTCNVMFEARPSDFKKGSAEYCSRKCLGPMYSRIFAGNSYAKGQTGWSKGKFGSEHPAWKGGKSNSNRSRPSTTTAEYRQWRKYIFERDNYTCQVCDQHGGTLHADHIKSWSNYPDLRYDTDNGRTLCVPCHYYVTFKRKMKPGTRWCNFILREVG